jgi:hypothetical protein
MSTVKSAEIYNIPPKSTTINKLTIVSTPAGIPPMEKHLPAMTWAGEEDSEVGAIERTGTPA